MAKKKTAARKAKKRNAADSTIRNVKASNKRFEAIDDRLNRLENRLSAVEEHSGIVPEDEDE